MNQRNETDFEPVEIAGEGTVLTDTDQRHLRLAIVELNNGLRAMGQLFDDEPKIGKRVRAVGGVVRQGGATKPTAYSSFLFKGLFGVGNLSKSDGF